jgi:lysozyme family protein
VITFDEAIERVLAAEGGYTNDPGDPGGETQWGISKRSYPDVNILALTREEAKNIYKRDFWEPVAAFFDASGFDASAMVFQMLDAAVNHGMDNAIRFLQRALGVVDDGHFGPVSRAAITLIPLADLHLLFIAERIEFFVRLSTFVKYGKGWMRRCARDLRYLAQDN